MTYSSRKGAPPRSAEYYFQQRRERRDNAEQFRGWRIRVEQIAGRDHLFRCYEKLRSAGGKAPGVDGFTYADFSPSEVGEILGSLSHHVLERTYRPQRVRPVMVPKSGTNEYRTIKIGTLCDRVLGKALDNAFKNFWERRFLPRSYGFRPRLNTWMMLADLEVAIRKTRRRTLVIDDVKSAFDTVPIADVMDCHRSALRGLCQRNYGKSDKARTLELVETLLRGCDPQRERGIDQGAPYSPTALNVLLHFKHDVPLTTEIPSNLLWFRYADNLVYLCRSMTAGERTLEHVGRLLQPLGLQLKSKKEDGVKNLYGGEEIQLLGFAIRWDGTGFCFRPGLESFNDLQQRLDNVHVERNPPQTAKQVVLGWIDALGPAYENGDVAEILSAIAKHGFRELVSQENVKARWKNSWVRWTVCRKQAGRHYSGTG